MKRNKKSGGGGANWMDTYGDMVTLLLCFFVMLYSMSRVDESKWIALVQSFNPDYAVDEPSQIVVPGEIANEPVTDLPSALTQDQVEAALEGLYVSMSEYVASAGLQDMVSLSKGSGYVFISFDDTIFFDGDSSVLKDGGKAILDQIAVPLAEASESINEIRVLGHTAQASPDRPNYVDVDRFLSSDRATVVTIYLQEKNIIDPARLVSVGYGQWRPIASNDTAETRAQNRRVELIISGIQPDSTEGDSLEQYYTIRGEEAVNVTEETASQAIPSS
ncbi:MAG TPA: flagellar motor protein MotB [Candidatus Avoscillospira avistercoris]|uniref:Flagellar motor protein MotB n=1 Tax=Candidatus Avoscillospira avistercoris TaxID=2840707 RepID=A0A9D1JU82_9FIRM|nr:flagellar motor protein MotB [Candidatus Avoscillospira avistercoris]